jgi:hypothetical protein
MEAVTATSVQVTELQPHQKLINVKQELLYKARNDRRQVFAAYCAQLSVQTCTQTNRRWLMFKYVYAKQQKLIQKYDRYRL